MLDVNSKLRIAEVEAGLGGGVIGITLCPGKKDAPRGHDRDLGKDLDIIRAWGASVVLLTLVQPFELAMLNIPHLGDEVRSRSIEWAHLPIRDVSIPDEDFEAIWPERSARFRALLAGGGKVLVHCRGGLGRAGMVAARLLVEMGISASLPSGVCAWPAPALFTPMNKNAGSQLAVQINGVPDA